MARILSKEVKNRIINNGEGRLYAVSDFADLNNDASVTRTLSRLENDKFLIRLSQGLYLYPIRNQYGIHKPSLSTIAQAIAERQGFEPWVPVRVQRFSRPPRSTTPASLQKFVQK